MYELSPWYSYEYSYEYCCDYCTTVAGGAAPDRDADQDNPGLSQDQDIPGYPRIPKFGEDK